MARLTKVPVENWDPDLRLLSGADGRTELENGTVRYFAHRPELAAAMLRYGGALKEHRELDSRLLELVRLRIAFHNQCRSCMAIRYDDAREAGVTEDLVCSLATPAEAPDLSPAERAAIRFGELFATNHLAIDDSVYAMLHDHFTEPQIVELALNVAWFVGMGRLAATLHMVEELPQVFRSEAVGEGAVSPWGNDSVLIGARPRLRPPD